MNNENHVSEPVACLASLLLGILAAGMVIGCILLGIC